MVRALPSIARRLRAKGGRLLSSVALQQQVSIDQDPTLNIHVDAITTQNSAKRYPVKLHHVKISEGQRTPILAIHGMFASWHVMEPSLQRMPDILEDRNVYCLDLRSHGESPRMADLSIPTMVEDIKMVLNRHNLEKAILIGHGLGGRVACATALSCPERVAGVVSVEGLPGNFTKSSLEKELADVFEKFVQVPVTEVVSRMEADKELSELLQGLTQEVHSMVLSSYMPDVGGKPGSWSWQFNLQALKKQCAEMLKWEELLDQKPGFHGEALFCTQDIWRSEDFNTTQRQFPHWQKFSFEGRDCVGTIIPDFALTHARLDFPERVEEFIKRNFD